MSAAILAAAIQNGSFPDSEDVLTSDVNTDDIPPLLDSIQTAKLSLRQTVRAISKHEAADVEGWITQAKKVQADIARCKEDAAQIVQEHDRIQSLRLERNESQNRVSLLENEMAFNEALLSQIQLISEAAAAMNTIDHHIRDGQLLHAAQSIPSINTDIANIRSGQSRALLSTSKNELARRLKARLDDTLNKQCQIISGDQVITLRIADYADGSHSMSLTETLDALDHLGVLDDAREHINKRLLSLLLPHFHKTSRLRLGATELSGDTLRLILFKDLVQSAETTKAFQQLLHYCSLRSAKISLSLLSHIAAQVVPRIIVNSLDAAVPVALDDVKQLDTLQEAVRSLVAWLKQHSLHEAHDLEAWVDQIPRTWLSRRRAASLDAVRAAFKLAACNIREVERVEKQTVVTEQQKTKTVSANNDWANSWEDDDHPATDDAKKSVEGQDDGSDAWGFDSDDQDGESTKLTTDAEEDEADAWGWGEEEESSPKPAASKKPAAKQANGLSDPQPKEQDMILTEKYIITDIPDYILEEIGKDITDFQTLSASPQTYFKSSSSPPPGMQNLPSLVLSMYRATAVDHYTTHSLLSRMNLYNDTLYLVQKLTESAVGPSSALQSDVDTLNKFARQVYTAEIAQQRTVLHDLLDNAQGFTSCTVQPYLSQCEGAITSTTDYLRSLHSQWSRVLSASHLSQSIGSLLSSVTSKMIKDIEDMEDIQESESQRLLQFMEQVSKLEELFVAPTPAAAIVRQVSNAGVKENDAPISTVALHCPSWLRFQYLQQILDGSLADIKYLWTDAGLSLEFSADEVVDLIEALFAESPHRRSAIQVFRSG